MEKFPRWRKSLRTNKPVVISDLQRLEKIYPDEAAFFQAYGVTTLLAAPFSKRINQGFIAVDDPTRYTDDPVFLFIASYLAALYLLASKERLWQPALSALSHDSIDFSCIVSKPHGFAIQDYPIFYSARRLYDLKSPMEAEDLAHPKLVSDLDFHNIIYATMIARYGKAVMDASKEAPEWAMC